MDGDGIIEKFVRACNDQNGNFAGWMIFCPGCKHGHLFDSRWTFNGDHEKPTFRASMLARWTEGYPPVTSENLAEYQRAPWPQTQVEKVCHSFVTDGNIQFLGDCTHELKGQTVPLEKF